jgi:hypothetical protein
LDFVRALQNPGQVGGRRGGSAGSGTGTDGRGYGIDLDAGEGAFGPGRGGGKGNGEDAAEEEEEEEEEEYKLVKDIIRASFPSFPPPPTTTKEGRQDLVPEQRQRRRQSASDESLSTSPFESTPASASKPASSLGTTTHHRRSSSTSGPARQFNNLISFLAFLTKENLLLSPGVGERIAIEMVRDTLSQHGGSIRSHSQAHSSTGPGRYEAGSGESKSTPWFGDAGSESISAVALWMIIMGEELFARVHEQEKQEELQRSRVGTRTGAGRGGIVDEWETWMARLQYLSLREDLNVEAREAAAEGAAVMRRV